MAYSALGSALASFHGTMAAVAIIGAAYDDMNAGMQTILENSLHVDFIAEVDVVKIPVSYGFYSFSSSVRSRCEIYVDYEEPFGDLLSRAKEDAIRFIEKAFTINTFGTENSITDSVQNIWTSANGYLRSEIGLFT